ncbi:toll-like receptor 5 [Engraulis encrasicolus]|uniref:toll-like receptor 5 n=1 Tax=Engraulis encrasicolus TaxID=184585 RepID=UPI002FCFF35D
MTKCRTISTLLLGAVIFLHVAKGTHQCIIDQHLAFCSSKSLTQVPQLPSRVTHVDLSLNRISHLSEDSFKGMESLVYLDLGSQRLERLFIKNNAFRGLQNLTYLHLGGNRNIHIEEDGFQGLTNLRTLILLTCDLDKSILSGRYLQPLVSLQELDLFGNKIKSFEPAMFFQNMTALSKVDLSLNRVKFICEEDLAGFQNKHFQLLSLSSTGLDDMNQWGFNWTQCGNPFKSMSFDTLDLSLTGLNTIEAKLFFTATEGTMINNLDLSSNTMGAGFGTRNIEDPDLLTFRALASSGIQTMDLSKTFISIVKSYVFKWFSDLVILSLAGSKISQFERGAFTGLTNLQKLNLSDNLIGAIYSYTFQNLPNLLVLDLTNNHIGAVQYDSFSGLFNLIALDLTGNALSSVYQFATLPNLLDLHLDDNKINSEYQLEDIASNVLRIRLNSNRRVHLEVLYKILSKCSNIIELDLSENVMPYCNINSEYSIPSSNNLQRLYLNNTGLKFVWERGSCLNIFDQLHSLSVLSLRGNLLQFLPNGIFKGLTSLHDLDLSYNSFTHLPRGSFPASLRWLSLAHNSLGTPDPELFQTLSFLDLNSNLFLCDCDLLEFQTWLNHTNATLFPSYSQMQCSFPEALRGVSLSNFSRDVQACEKDDEQQVQELRLLLFIGCTTVVMVTILLNIIYGRFRGRVFMLYKKLRAQVIEGLPKEPLPENHQYDVYLCFTESDFTWVEAALLKRLDSEFTKQNQKGWQQNENQNENEIENGHRFRCCFEARDFLPGEDHLSNIRSAVWGSRKTLCVVSPSFLRDGWCLEALAIAQSRMLEELRDLLLVLVVGPIPYFRLMRVQAIRAVLKDREYLTWPEDSQDLEWFFHRLVGKIAKNSKVKGQQGNGGGTDVALQVVRQVQT